MSADAESRGDVYDVFVSFSGADRAFARELDERLTSRRLRTFFDERDLDPGTSWVPAIEAAIERSRAFALLMGPHPPGCIQKREREAAFVRASRDPRLLLIPVLIPGCVAEPTGFLSTLTWADLRAGLDAVDGLESLVGVLRGKGAAIPPEPACPYLGLERFDESDAALFCGRERVVAELVASVQRHPLTVVVGRSGSGKSSLVFAGLFPQLRRQKSIVWDTAALRPGAAPFEALASALRAPEATEDPTIDSLRADAGRLRDEPGALGHTVARRLGSGARRADRLLLYVDQWEELYVPGAAAEADRFVDLLVATVQDTDLRTAVVVTVRSDFYGALLSDRRLAPFLPQQQVNLGPMTAAELRAAIVTPATRAGLRFESESLVDEIVRDAGADGGGLPLLQYALKATWARRNGSTLTAAGYTSSGRVIGALRETAERVYAALTQAEKEVARRLFLQLVTPGDGSEDTRARIQMPADPEVRAVVHRFSEASARLLLVGSEPDGGASPAHATVEVAHEALIRTWAQLREWLDDDRARLLARAAVVRQRDEWEGQQRRDDLLLPSGFQLERARALLQDPGRVPIDDLRAYFEQSAAAAAELQERAAQTARAERERLRRQSRGRLMAAVSGAAASVAIGVLAFEAEVRHRETETVSARYLAQDAQLLANQGHNAQAAAAVVRAFGQSSEVLSQVDLLQGALAGYAAAGLGSPLPLPPALGGEGRPYSVTSVGLSRDAKWVVAAVGSGAVVWSRTDRRLVTMSPLEHPAAIVSASFLPGDDVRILVACEDGTVRIWTLDRAGGPARPRDWKTLPALAAAVLSPDATRLVVAGNDGVELRDVATWAPVRIAEGAVHGVAFSSDGRWLLLRRERTVEIVGVDRVPRRLPVPTGELDLAVFAPDDDHMVTGKAGAVLRTWDLRVDDSVEGPALGPDRNHLHGGDLSRDRRFVLLGADQGGARLWEPSSRQVRAQVPPCGGIQREVFAASFSADGRWMATGQANNAVCVWPVTYAVALGAICEVLTARPLDEDLQTTCKHAQALPDAH